MKERIGKNSVFIATSLDGYIADRNGGLAWLNLVPAPDNSDGGFGKFIANMDAIIMGRNTFETVCGFDMDWPYILPVFVMSNTLNEIPPPYENKAFLINGSLDFILNDIHQKGYQNLYIDGGRTIQHFLERDLIDELTITTIPILLGGGIPLFGDLKNEMKFELVASTVYHDHLVQNQYSRKRG